MLSRGLLREHPETVRQGLAARGADAAQADRWIDLDFKRRSILVESEALKATRNEASRAIGEVKKKGGDAAEQIAAVATIKARIGELEGRLETVDADLQDLEMGLPNLPHESVPIGADESANRVERTVGEPPTLGFEAKAHWDLGPDLGILDFERGAKVAGARFTAYYGAGARLERALIQLMLDLHTGSHGYLEVQPPFIVNSRALIGTSQLPKFAEDLFKLEGHDYYLTPTAEVPLTNLRADEILEESELPVRYAAYTPCFRAEAGSYGKDVRGIIRQHQFNKVELVHLTTPETSYEALDELTANAERVLQLLELPYQVVTLSSGDMGFAAARTHDIEVWLPGQSRYREISSCSNCTDFQARRANIRYRPEGGGKPRYVHTLNGSGLAAGRTVVAVLENYQQADGTVLIPKALAPYMGGLKRIG